MMISVVMPAYNAEKWIGRAIRSVLAQTYTNWELCIVDDASKDGTLEAIKEASGGDKRIRLERLDENIGCGLARRKSIAMCKGDYIAFLDADDWFEPTMFADMLEAMVATNSEIAICGVFNHRDDKYIGQNLAEKQYCTSKEELYRQYMEGLWVMQYNGNKIYSRRVIDAVEYSDMRYCEDSATTYLWLWESQCTVVIPRSYYHYFQHSDSNSNDKTNTLEKSLCTVKCVHQHHEFCKENGMQDLIPNLLRYAFPYLSRCLHEYPMPSQEFQYCNNIRNSLYENWRFNKDS